VIFDENSFPLATSPNLSNIDFLLESGSTVSTVGTQLPPAGTTTTATRQPTPVVPPGFEPLMAPLPALVVPPSFLPRTASTTSTTLRVVPPSPVAPRAVPLTPVAPCAVPESPTVTDGPPRQWSSSSIVYAKRPRQHTPSAPAGPASTMPARRPPTTVPVTPPVNPHRMVTRAKAGFRVLPDRLVLVVASSSPSTPSPIPSSVRAALTDLYWRAAMEDEYGP
jgi:hypothetical protein